jgi:hypothetical protein
MNDAPTRTIYLIRHGEKPPDPPKKPPPFGVDVDGNTNEHSLIPPGWQRAGALVTLFAPFGGEHRAGLLTPDQLICPDYGDDTSLHRTHETIYPLSQSLGIEIQHDYKEGKEAELGAELGDARTGVTLVCWEHKALHLIANAIQPTAAQPPIPQHWPSKRFDVVFVFSWGGSEYVFSQVPQNLLAGDKNKPLKP